MDTNKLLEYIDNEIDCLDVARAQKGPYGCEIDYWEVIAEGKDIALRDLREKIKNGEFRLDANVKEDHEDHNQWCRCRHCE